MNQYKKLSDEYSILYCNIMDVIMEKCSIKNFDFKPDNIFFDKENNKITGFKDGCFIGIDSNNNAISYNTITSFTKLSIINLLYILKLIE